MMAFVFISNIAYLQVISLFRTLAECPILASKTHTLGSPFGTTTNFRLINPWKQRSGTFLKVFPLDKVKPCARRVFVDW